MSELLLQIGVSNVLISLALAVVAWAVHVTGKRPLVAHLLWVLVLVKLITPPIFTVPVLPALGLDTTAKMHSEDDGLDAASASMLAPLPDGWSGMLDESATSLDANAASAWFVEHGATGLSLLWIFGSACILVWSLVRIFRFNRLLDIASEAAPPDVQRTASEIAQRLGLKATPTISTTSAHISPMVWWIGGRVRILIPAAFCQEMNATQLRWILAHELAHVRRRDHLVRWLEWLACVGFWWNPVAWWARRNLRINEEICCDALVLRSMKPSPRTYAHALMTVVEFLASPAIRPPAVASEINSGGFLERRFRMIVSNSSIPRTQRWVRASIVLCAAALLPLGLASAGAASPEGKTDKQVADKPAKSQLLDVLSELVVTGAMDGKTAYELYLASEEPLKQRLVAAGKTTPEAFDKKLGMAMRFKIVEAELKQAVAAGEISEEDARARLAEMKRGAKRWTREDFAHAEAKIRDAIAEGKLTEEEGRTKLEAMRKAMAAEHDRDSKHLSREDYARAEAELKALVAAGKISEEDARMRLEEMRKAMAGDGERAAAMQRRIAAALSEAGIERDQIRNVMDAMHRIIGEVHAEGDAFELDPGMAAYLEKLGLTDEQIELVVGLSRRVAMAEKDRSHDRAEGHSEHDKGHVDWDAIKKRVEGAVERGEMTREEADALYAGIHARMKGSHDASRLDWEAIQERIEDAVERGEMTREEADAKYREIRARMAEPHGR